MSPQHVDLYSGAIKARSTRAPLYEYLRDRVSEQHSSIFSSSQSILFSKKFSGFGRNITLF